MKANELIKGNWYKDNEGDFIKFNYCDDNIHISQRLFLSQLQTYRNETFTLNKEKYTYEPMTIEEMKEHLPESEWWVEEQKTVNLFPIY